MKTKYGHLTYCTNIHGGETWAAHFENIQTFIPAVKAAVAPGQAFGIGLRLSNEASLELSNEKILTHFKQWLDGEGCYVFTLNGFPYGGFHGEVVKDKVHYPDWTTAERVQYTVRLSNILAQLLPPETDGGISTSPLSYRHWFKSDVEKKEGEKESTKNIIAVVEHLIHLKKSTGKTIHLDIEPEPDGLLENGLEFLHWYEHVLMPAGTHQLAQHLGLSETDAIAAIKEHVQLCYDVCHFAIGFENAKTSFKALQAKGIKIGKIQISAALKAVLPKTGPERVELAAAFEPYNEPTYLHQVVALLADGSLKKYPDLPQALSDVHSSEATEWRAHFHVPIFAANYGQLQSTQEDIIEVLGLHRQEAVKTHLEVETYTWEVLPPHLKLPLQDSIIRELTWVRNVLHNQPL